jgi:pyruvate carboxylase subunit B
VRKNEPKKEEAKKDAAGGYTVTVNGKKYAVEVKGDKATVNGKSYDIAVADGIAAAPAKSGTTHESADSTLVKAQMPGKVMKVAVAVGDHVNSGDILLVLEAMKMEVEIKSPVTGTVSSVGVAVGEQVSGGQELASIN